MNKKVHSNTTLEIELVKLKPRGKNYQPSVASNYSVQKSRSQATRGFVGRTIRKGEISFTKKQGNLKMASGGNSSDEKSKEYSKKNTGLSEL